MSGTRPLHVSAAMGQIGRITSVADLPPRRVLAGYVKQPMKLNEEGVTAPRQKAGKPKPGDSGAA